MAHSTVVAIDKQGACRNSKANTPASTLDSEGGGSEVWAGSSKSELYRVSDERRPPLGRQDSTKHKEKHGERRRANATVSEVVKHRGFARKQIGRHNVFMSISQNSFCVS